MSDLRGHVSHAIAKRTAKQLRTRMKILTWQDNAPQTRLFFRHVCLKFLGDGLGHKIGTDTSGHGVVSLNLNEQTIAEAINHRLSLSLSFSVSDPKGALLNHQISQRTTRCSCEGIAHGVGCSTYQDAAPELQGRSTREVTMTAWGQWLALVTTTAQQLNSLTDVYDS